MVTVEYVKAYCRIEEDPDNLLPSLIAAAEGYLTDAGVSAANSNPALYQLAVAGIVLHWHDNRCAADSSAPQDFEPGIRKVINQLKLSSRLVSNLDTSC